MNPIKKISLTLRKLTTNASKIVATSFLSVNRGQITIGGVIGITLVVVVFTALFPTIVNQVGNASAATSDTATSSIIDLIPLFVAIGMLASTLVYSRINQL